MAAPVPDIDSAQAYITQTVMRDGDETGLVMQPSIEHVLELMFAIRLGDDLVHAGLAASLTVRFRRVGGERDHRGSAI